MDEKFVVENLGQIGVVRDQPPASLPVNAWTTGYNVRMRDGSARSVKGWEPISPCDQALDTRHSMNFQGPGRYHWLSMGELASAGYVCGFDGTLYSDLTPTAGLNIRSNDQWSGGIFNGLPIMHNGQLNDPCFWDHVGGAARFEPLPFDASNTWSQAGYAADIVRPLGNFLVALGIYRSAAYYPQLVAWSDIAEPGTYPESWDKDDRNTLAGESPIAETGGALIDLLPLHGVGVIYREGSIWTMRQVQSELVFDIDRALSTIGMLAPNCVTEIEGNRHVVLGGDDAVVHNTQSAQSILDQRMRKYIFRTMDTDNFRNSFVVRNDAASEVWICYPLAGAVFPNLAIVWNWREDTLTERQLPDFTAMITHAVEVPKQPTGGIIWDSMVGILWDEFRRLWKERNFNPTITALMSASGTEPMQLESGNLANGTPMRCYAERIGLSLAGRDRRAMLSRIYPVMEGGEVNIYVGAQEAPKAPVSWQSPKRFRPGIDSFINCEREGLLHAIRIQSEADVEWSISGWTGLYTPTGSV